MNIKILYGLIVVLFAFTGYQQYQMQQYLEVIGASLRKSVDGYRVAQRNYELHSHTGRMDNIKFIAQMRKSALYTLDLHEKAYIHKIKLRADVPPLLK